jgi:shikimate dehydrogenase
MPLKERVLSIIAPRDSIVDTLHAANTVYRSGRTRVLSNTDPFGVEHALERFDIHAERAWILGAGATARSVGYALWKRGATSVTIFARGVERAERTAHYLRQCGLDTQVQHFSELERVMPPQLVASTLPGDQEDLPNLPPIVIDSAALFDVAYSPWPSHYAKAWAHSSQPVVSGLWMLAYQALAQIRLFVHKDVTRPLPDEDKVFAAMLAAVGLSPE